MLNYAVCQTTNLAYDKEFGDKECGVGAVNPLRVGPLEKWWGGGGGGGGGEKTPKKFMQGKMSRKKIRAKKKVKKTNSCRRKVQPQALLYNYE